MQRKSGFQSKTPKWQIWGITLVAALFTVALVVRNNLQGRDRFSDADMQAGYLIGNGLGFALGFWLIAYFLVLRKASRRDKWLSFLIITASGIGAAHI